MTPLQLAKIIGFHCQEFLFHHTQNDFKDIEVTLVSKNQGSAFLQNGIPYYDLASSFLRLDIMNSMKLEKKQFSTPHQGDVQTVREGLGVRMDYHQGVSLPLRQDGGWSYGRSIICWWFEREIDLDLHLQPGVQTSECCFKKSVWERVPSEWWPPVVLVHSFSDSNSPSLDQAGTCPSYNLLWYNTASTLGNTVPDRCHFPLASIYLKYKELQQSQRVLITLQRQV